MILITTDIAYISRRRRSKNNESNNNAEQWLYLARMLSIFLSYVNTRKNDIKMISNTLVMTIWINDKMVLDEFNNLLLNNLKSKIHNLICNLILTFILIYLLSVQFLKCLSKSHLKNVGKYKNVIFFFMSFQSFSLWTISLTLRRAFNIEKQQFANNDDF